MAQDHDTRARETAGAVARRSYGKLVALLAVRTRDVAGAEDALSEASRNCENFVASPKHNGNTPVASGSRLPVCPTFCARYNCFAR